MKAHIPILLGLVAALSVAGPNPAIARAVDAPAPKMGSTFYDWNAIPVDIIDNGYRRAVDDWSTSTLNRLSIHATTLNPGTSSHPHPQGHAQEEAILFKEGQIRMIMNGVEHPVPSGSLVFLASHVVHNLTNVGTTPATYYVIDFYTDATATVPDQPADFWASADKLHTTVFDCESLPAVPTKTGFRRNIVSSPTVTLLEFESHITTLNPGNSSGVLTGLADEVIIIKSGYVQATIDGVSANLGAGSFYFQASGTVHSIKNQGGVPASYQVLKFVSDKTPHKAT